MAQVPAELAQRMREAARAWAAPAWGESADSEARSARSGGDPALGVAGEPAGSAGWDGSPAARADWLIAQLRRLGDALLAEARSAPPGQRTALTLLAADAFMTLACEALAELAPERLGEFR